MSTFDAKDLPPIAQYFQVIILGCIVEAQFRAQYGQHMQPDEARLQAITMNTAPPPWDEMHKEMIDESFRVAYRLFKAFKTLEITVVDNRKISADALISAGL